MKKIKLSGVDIGAIVAFVVLTLAGIGGWYYFSGNLKTAQDQASTAKQALDRYSQDKKFKVVVSHRNASTLQINIDTYKAQLEPLIDSTFFSKDDKLGTIKQEDPVAWKHDLDDQVHALTTAAKRNSVSLPKDFFFGFSRYQGQSPGDEQTAVLSKQLLGVEQITDILINAQVKSIHAIRRVYEEEAHPPTGSAAASEGDLLIGSSYSVPNIYTVHPFEVDFQCSPETLRPIVNALIGSPYILILRSLTVRSTVGTSPRTSDLDRMAGPPPDTSAISTSPGEVAQAPAPTKGPQFLFGNANIEVKARIDMIEWTYKVSDSAPPSNPAKK